jgi:GTP-binding protein
MFVDEAEIEITAGDGGHGAVAFRREKFVPRGGPAGGDGGKGGDIIFVATNNCNTLSDFRHMRHLRAEHGKNGGTNNMSGRGGPDVVVNVPVGTIITDVETGEILIDFDHPDQRFLAARGGDGGQGNSNFATATNRTPKRATAGWPGVHRRLHLELKLIADVALVGYPSVGKSTIISVLSNARPKIADYPFTTLVPNLGVVKFGDYGEYVVADVPGLIEGAHEGHGLGIQFLKHIERTNLIAHVIEVTPQLEGHETERNPIADFEHINNELEKFSRGLKETPQLVVLNKVDLPYAADQLENLRAHFEDELGLPFVAISAAAHINLDELRNRLGEAVAKKSFQPVKEAWES